MPKVTVYYFKMYDIITDQMIQSRRMTTLEKITELGGVPLKETGKEVDTFDIDPDGFYPRKKY